MWSVSLMPCHYHWSQFQETFVAISSMVNGHNRPLLSLEPWHSQSRSWNKTNQLFFCTYPSLEFFLALISCLLSFSLLAVACQHCRFQISIYIHPRCVWQLSQSKHTLQPRQHVLQGIQLKAVLFCQVFLVQTYDMCTCNSLPAEAQAWNFGTQDGNINDLHG